MHFLYIFMSVFRGFAHYRLLYQLLFALPREISFLALKHKIHIFELMCNVLFIIWRPDVLNIADFYFIVLNNRASFTSHR